MPQRSNVVSVRLTDDELAWLDELREDGEDRGAALRRMIGNAAVPPGTFRWRTSLPGVGLTVLDGSD